MEHYQAVANDFPIVQLVVVGREMVFDQTPGRGELHQYVEIVFEQIRSDRKTFRLHFGR